MFTIRRKKNKKKGGTKTSSRPPVPERIIRTPGLYWGGECANGRSTCDNSDIKMWGKEYGNNKYTPSTFYVDFKDIDWHSYNMNKSTKCNLKDWANMNGIFWDGITNSKC